MNIDEVLKMTEDMELISDFLTNARFVGDRVHVSIEHLADCIRNRLPSEASAEALEVFDAMIKYGEHQMECSFEELLNNMKVKEAKQTIRAALATPVGWKLVPIEPTEDMYLSGCEKICNDLEDGEVASCSDVYKAMIAVAPPHTEERG